MQFNREKIPFVLLGLISVSYLVSLFALEVFVASLFLYWLYDIKLKVKNSIDTIGYLVLLFGVGRVISAFLSPFRDLATEQVLKEILFYLAALPSFYYINRISHTDFKKLIQLFIATGAIVSLYAVVTFYLGIYHRAQSITSGYTTYSLYASTLFVMALFSSGRKEKSNKELVVFIASLTLMLSGIILSIGRINIAIVALFLVVGVVLVRPNFKYIALVVVLTGVISFLGFKANNAEIKERVANPGYLSDRDILYKGFFELAPKHPIFGVGGGTFKTIFPYKEQFADKGIGAWHNDFLQMFIEGGTIGVLLYLALLLFIGKKVFEGIRNANAGKERDLQFGLAAALLTMLGSSLTGGFIVSPEMSIFFIMIVSFVFRESSVSDSAN